LPRTGVALFDQLENTAVRTRAADEIAVLQHADCGPSWPMRRS